MANRNTQGFPSPEEDPRFHDTYQFLRRYRDATYSLKVVVHQMEHQFKLQYDNDIDKFLDSIYAAGLILPEATSNNGQKVLPEATRC